MNVQLDYWNPDKNYNSEITRQETIEADNDIEIFEQFYKKNNSLRYCNGSFYRFTSQEWQDKYNAWLQSDDYKAKSFNLYYGGGVVD
jgi:hypothetical protein